MDPLPDPRPARRSSTRASLICQPYLQAHHPAALIENSHEPVPEYSLMTHVDLCFPARGETIPRDHGYALYGALSRSIPDLHGVDWLAVHGIGAKLLGGQTLSLRPRGTLRIRIPVERIATMLPLAGRAIDVVGRPVVLGAPSVQPLNPASSVDARLVVIKLTGGVKRETAPFIAEEFAARFRAEAMRQLAALGIAGELESGAGPRFLSRAVGLSAVRFACSVSALITVFSFRSGGSAASAQWAVGYFDQRGHARDESRSSSARQIVQ